MERDFIIQDKKVFEKKQNVEIETLISLKFTISKGFNTYLFLKLLAHSHHSHSTLNLFSLQSLFSCTYFDIVKSKKVKCPTSQDTKLIYLLMHKTVSIHLQIQRGWFQYKKTISLRPEAV
ncbi:hypothetical protein ABPG74_009726 [Tetrahymena malaccensis]